jgi:hypothetical protein
MTSFLSRLSPLTSHAQAPKISLKNTNFMVCRFTEILASIHYKPLSKLGRQIYPFGTHDH